MHLLSPPGKPITSEVTDTHVIANGNGPMIYAVWGFYQGSGVPTRQPARTSFRFLLLLAARDPRQSVYMSLTLYRATALVLSIAVSLSTGTPSLTSLLTRRHSCPLPYLYPYPHPLMPIVAHAKTTISGLSPFEKCTTRVKHEQQRTREMDLVSAVTVLEGEKETLSRGLVMAEER